MTVKITAAGSQEVKKAVRSFYSDAIKVKSGKSACSCGCSRDRRDVAGKEALYEDPDIREIPGEITETSFGCGDPVTLASLVEGQTVVDLGSGGGLDCFLAGRRVGASGHVIGVDMTPEMIDRARSNQEKVGAANVEFRLGEIEHLPVADQTVDVVISNCVINLSTDKPQVFREIYRVLKPGGRMAVSDIVTRGNLSDKLRQNLTGWAFCVSGAMDVDDYTGAIRDAGFEQVTAVPVFMDEEGIADSINESEDEEVRQWNPAEVREKVFSAKVTAVKPVE